MRKIFVSVVAALALFGVSVPSAPAAGTTVVHLDVDLAGAIEEADCDVTVPEGSDGLDVLDQAKLDGCINSYTTQDFGFGEYVDCINDICEQPSALPTVVWLIYLEDGSFADVGVSDLSFPDDGDVLAFSYEAWPVHSACFFFDVGCPGDGS